MCNKILNYSGNPSLQHFFLQNRTSISHHRDATLLCTSHWILHILLSPYGLLCISSRLRMDISNLQKSWSNWVPHTQTLIFSTFHGRIISTPHLLLHHSGKMLRLASDKKPSFLWINWHSKFGSIFGLNLTDLSTNCSNIYNLNPPTTYTPG